MRWYVSVWIISVAIVCVILGSLASNPSPVVPPDLVLPKAPVVVIGSSLIRHGVPATGGPDASLLGDGRSHIRLAINGIAESQALDFARLAIAAGSKTILIEIFPFCRDFANDIAFEREKEQLPIAWARTLLVQSRAMLKNFNRRVLGHGARTRNVSAFMQDAGFAVAATRNSYKLTELYPLNLREPIEAAQLTEVLALAKSKGVEIYFLAPPRSKRAADFQGAAAMTAQNDHAQVVADRFGVELINIGPVWPDTYFVDQGHVNLAGQQRFVQELRDWWAKHNGT